MKIGNTKTLVLVMTTVGLLSATLVWGAAEKKQEYIRGKDRPARMRGQFELTEERIERMMNHLAKVNPKQAEELEQLRAKDPDKFRVELRESMREQFGRRNGDRWEEDFGRRLGPTKERPFGPGPAGPGKPDYGPRTRMRERHAEYLEWLEENYPEESERLAKVREEDPELYMRQIGLSLKKYGRIAEAAKENPELAEILKHDLELKEQRNKLLRKIKTANDDEREKLVKELQDVVSARFDLIVKRKQIRYEQLLEKLEKLREEVEQNEVEVDKWKDTKFKNKNIKVRIEELLSRTEKFDWD
jgi:hypothetical protein